MVDKLYAITTRYDIDETYQAFFPIMKPEQLHISILDPPGDLKKVKAIIDNLFDSTKAKKGKKNPPAESMLRSKVTAKMIEEVPIRPTSLFNRGSKTDATSVEENTVEESSVKSFLSDLLGWSPMALSPAENEEVSPQALADAAPLTDDAPLTPSPPFSGQTLFPALKTRNG